MESMAATASAGSVGTSSAPMSAPTSSPQSSSPTSNQPAQAKSQTQVGAKTQNSVAQAANQTQNTPEQNQGPRKLSDQDMDALVTVKINGKTEELPLKEVIKLQQLERVSHEKLRQAAEMQKKAQELMQMDFERLAQLRGLDPDEWAEERLAKKYELMQMSPEQRRLMELEHREQQRAAMEKQEKSQIIEQIKQWAAELPPGIENASKEQLIAFAQQQKQVYEMAEQSLERELVDAWKESGLPEDKYFGHLIALKMKWHQDQTNEPLQAAQAASKVKEEFGGHVRRILGKMDAEAIHEFLGKDLLTKLREFDVQRVTGSQLASNMNQSRPDTPSASQEKKYLNQIEWRKAMGLT